MRVARRQVARAHLRAAARRLWAAPQPQALAYGLPPRARLLRSGRCELHEQTYITLRNKLIDNDGLARSPGAPTGGVPPRVRLRRKGLIRLMHRIHQVAWAWQMNSRAIARLHECKQCLICYIR